MRLRKPRESLEEYFCSIIELMNIEPLIDKYFEENGSLGQQLKNLGFLFFNLKSCNFPIKSFDELFLNDLIERLAGGNETRKNEKFKKWALLYLNKAIEEVYTKDEYIEIKEEAEEVECNPDMEYDWEFLKKLNLESIDG